MRQALLIDSKYRPVQNDQLLERHVKYGFEGVKFLWNQAVLVGPRVCSIGDNKSVVGHILICPVVKNEGPPSPKYLVNLGVLPGREDTLQFNSDCDKNATYLVEGIQDKTEPIKWYNRFKYDELDFKRIPSKDYVGLAQRLNAHPSIFLRVVNTDPNIPLQNKLLRPDPITMVPNRHAEYFLTWATLAVLSWQFLRPLRRRAIKRAF